MVDPALVVLVMLLLVTLFIVKGQGIRWILAVLLLGLLLFLLLAWAGILVV